jgi:hypothetical protein
MIKRSINRFLLIGIVCFAGNLQASDSRILILHTSPPVTVFLTILSTALITAYFEVKESDVYVRACESIKPNISDYSNSEDYQVALNIYKKELMQGAPSSWKVVPTSLLAGLLAYMALHHRAWNDFLFHDVCGIPVRI